jgi:hypothetical protein
MPNNSQSDTPGNRAKRFTFFSNSLSKTAFGTNLFSMEAWRRHDEQFGAD